MSERIVIAGATGYLGRHLVHTFKSRGWRVNALVRSAAAARRAGIAPADMLVVDPRGAERLAEVMREADAVFSAVGLTRQRDGLTYDQVDYGVNLALLKAAIKAGAPRFGYAHVLNGENMRRSALARAKCRFVKALEGAAIQQTVIAPSAYFSDMEDFLEMARRGRVYLVGEGDRRMNPIHGADLASVSADALIAGTARVNVGGPDVFTQAEIAELAFETLGRPPRIMRVPQAVAGLAVGALKLVGPQRMWGPAEFFLEASSMDMVGAEHGKKHLAAHFKGLAEGMAK